MSIKSLKNQSFTNKSYFNSINLSGGGGTGGTAAPVITSIIICDSNYNNLDDTAIAPGGSFVKLIGTGFKTGCTVYFNNQSLSATFISSSEVRIETPATTVGSYNIMLFNPGTDGGAIYLNLSVSNAPTWTTNAGSLGTQYETTSVNTSVSATGDTPIVYSLFSGNLPAGTTLSSNGTLSGTAPVEASSTTYSFTVNAKDAQNQDTTRTFSLTISVDVVSWTTPTDNQVISSYEYSPISNVTLLASSAAGYNANNYTANALPTGITLVGNTISGTANSIGNTFTRLTATSNTSGRSATRDIVFNVNQDVVSWSSPADQTAYSLVGGTPIANVTLSATSAAGRTITYTANALPSGLSISGSVITGTPNSAQTVTTLLTATADTTNRSATRTISWSINLGDLNWKNTVLLLSANTPTPTFVTDTSLNNYQLSITGDARASNFDPHMGGYYSNLFDGTGDYLTLPTNAAFAIGTADFTVEMWVMPTNQNLGWTTLFAGVNYGASSDWGLYGGDSTNTLYPMFFFTGSATQGNGASQTQGSQSLTGYTRMTINQWNHIAVSRVSGTARMFLNGTQTGPSVNASTWSLTNTLQKGIGGGFNGNSSTLFTGYISNLRVLSGTGLYSANFTPPTSPLTSVANTILLTCQSSRLIDTSVNNFTVTKAGDTTVSSAHPFDTPTTVSYNNAYSLYFPASTGDSITYTASSSLLGAGDWTIETWAYALSLTSFDTILSTTSNQIILRYSGNTGWQLYYDGAGQAVTFATAGTNGVNRWTHHAVTRSGSTIRWFINGVLVHTGTSTTDYTGVLARLGATSSSYGYNGYISNMRMVKGTSLYNSNFTPSTSPLTNISGTTLLTNSGPLSRDYSNNNSTVALSSGAVIYPSAISPFNSTANTTVVSLGSGYFDGASDVLTLPAGQFPNLGTSNFTIEAWIYTNTIAAGSGGVFDMWNGGTTAFLLRRSGSTLQFYVQGGSNIQATPLVANAWTHVAAVRNGTTITVYINGVPSGTAITAYSTSINSGGIALGVGGTATSGGESFNGYITDARIIVGTALYTSTFLPPQAPLTPIANTVLLTCQTNGGANNSAFMDQSSFNNIITRTGVVTQGTFSPYSQTGWSNYFDGTGDYLTTSTNAAFTYGTSDFTIEMWVYITANPGDYAYTYTQGPNTTASMCVYIQGGVFRVWNGSNIITGSTSYSLNTWYHVAVSRSGTSLKLFVNGSQDGSVTNSSNITTGTTYGGTIGRWIEISDTRHFTGYVSNLRVVKGTALYTSSFTPPTSPLTAVSNTSLLTCQDNRFIDESPNNFTITKTGDVSVQAFSPFGGVTSLPISYSTSFVNSTNDYISSPASSAFAFGTGAYTIEAWAYFRTLATYRTVFEVTGGPLLTVMIDGAIRIWNSDTTFLTTATGIISANTWYHFAWVRESTSLLKLYVNGTSVISVTSGAIVTTNLTGTPTVNLGYFTGYGHYMNGFISNVRITKGQALYTTNFTPSTTPLTTTSQGATSANVSLLTCQSNTMIDNSINNFTLTPSGSPSLTAVNPFGQTNTTPIPYSPSVNSGSIYFNGGGNYYLNVVDSPSIELGSSDFTLEGWFYWTGGLTGWTLFQKASSYELKSDTSRWVWQVNGASNVFITSFTPVANQWYHIALVRTTTTTKLYINGVLFTSGTSVDANDTGNPLSIGYGSAPFVGYASDIRITRTALYTNNFYPGPTPATPTTTIGANRYISSLLINGTSGGTIDYHSTNVLDTYGNTLLAPQDPYAGNYYSAYFDGTGDFLTVPNSTNFAFGTGDFTVEFWIKTSDTAGGIISQTSSGWAFVISSGSFFWQSAYNITNLWNYAAGAVTDGRWHHVAVVRNSGTTRLYYDGVQVASNADSTNYSVTTGTVQIGRDSAPADFQGYMSNLRVVKGTALYTSAFTPSTTPLTTVTGTSLLTFQSNKFIDNSLNNLAFTLSGTPGVNLSNPFQYNSGKSIYFDGTGDYLSVPVSPNMTFGSSDFTFETWVYPTGVTAQQTIAYLNANATGYAAIVLQIQNGALNLWSSSTGSTWALQQASIGTIVAGGWTHIAVTKSGTTMRVYINGTQAGTNYTVGQSLMTTHTLNQIGVYNTSSNLLTGYLKDLRITKAVRYTTTFTPPTAPFDIK